MMNPMIATIDIADLSRRSLIRAVRHRPAPADTPGLRWLDVAPAVPLASKRPPGLRRAVRFAMWNDQASADLFAHAHPLAEQAAGFRAVLQPLRAFGTWPGLPADIPRSRVTDHNGPVIVTTLGRLRLTQVLRFMRASRPAERAAVAADGFLWGTAAARPPFVATVSVWSSDDEAAAYAYSEPDAGHPRAITQQRRKDFHHQSAFVRYAIISSTGALPDVPPIDLNSNIAPGRHRHDEA